MLRRCYWFIGFFLLAGPPFAQQTVVPYLSDTGKGATDFWVFGGILKLACVTPGNPALWSPKSG